MSKSKVRFSEKVMSVFLAILMIFTAVPVTAFASNQSAVSTDMASKDFRVGKATEFTFSTVAGENAGVLVKGTFEFSDNTAVDKLEYLETHGTDAGKWFEFYGDFGPDAGFPLIDGTSTFRVTFKKSGNYTLKVAMKRVDNGEVVCSTENAVVVAEKEKSVISSDIGEKNFVVGKYTEFTFTTTAKDFAGVMVLGSFEFSNKDAIESLQYKETHGDNAGKWFEFYGDFGPATGFPMIDGTSSFRVKFREAGDFSVVASMKYANGENAGTVLCSTETINLHVKDYYNVNLPSVEGGTVSIDKEGNKFVEGTKLVLDVNPDSEHYIASVKINNEVQTISDPTSFSKEITVNKDINVDVEFIRIYTVVVEYDTTMGTVNTLPETLGGSVTVTQGTSVTITATPGDTYRVLKVSVTDMPEENFVDNTYNKSNPYTKTLNADKDYKVVVTFAPLIYNVTVNAPANGTLSVSDTPVNYGGSTVITINPDEGYCVDTITVNNVDFYSNLVDVESSDTALTVSIDEITEDKDVVVTFKKTETAKNGDYVWNSADNLRVNDDNTEYIFDSDTDIAFYTDKEGIRLTFADGTTDGDKDSRTVVIQKDKKIKKIEVRYDHAWHVAEISDKGISIYFDGRKPTVTAEAAEALASGYYNSDVDINVSAKDFDNYSGLEVLEYWVECDGEETLPKTSIYKFEEDADIVDEIKDETITVSAVANNSDNVVVYIQATDRAGNKSEIKEIPLKICATAPVIDVDFNDEQPTEAVENWYNFDRKATITITDRADVFDATVATNGFIFAEGSSENISITEWKSEGNTHTATVTFAGEGTFDWTFTYKNKAELDCTSQRFSFRQDKTAPSGVISANSATWDGDGVDWNQLLEKLTFGLYSNKEVAVGLKENSDNLSGFQSVTYYKSNTDEVLAESTLAELFAEGKFTPDRIVVSADEQFAVYARIVDNAGNVRYIGTDGVIYDMTQSEIAFDVIDKANADAIYGIDNVKTYSEGGKDFNGIKVAVNVKDANADSDYYSGLKKITYRVLMDSNQTQTGTLFEYKPASKPAKKDLQREWAGEVIINADKNNGKNVVLEVTVVDNADNESTDSITLKEINLDELTAIVGVTGSAVTLEDGYGWYNNTRTATITIKDRASCFLEDAATAAIKVKATNAAGEEILLGAEDVVFGTWTNNDDIHSINVDFVANGNYTWSIEYTNKAGNTLKASEINSGNAESPYAFTVDKQDPTGSVTVDTNTWETLLKVLTFGLYNQAAPEVSSTADDGFSPVKKEYYLSSSDTALSKDDLDALYNDVNADNFTSDIPVITGEQQFALYMRVTDNAGNYIYVSSDGYVIDATQTDLFVNATDAPNTNGIYGINDVKEYTVNGKTVNGIKVAVSAKEAEYAEDSYSGIKSITYVVKSVKNGKLEETQTGTLYDFDYKRDNAAASNGGKLSITDSNKDSVTEKEGKVPVKADLCREWAGCIVVDSALNNSCKTYVTVTVTDNAGNEKTETAELDIDITAPTVQVSFDTDAPKNEKYYNAPRSATVIFTEREHHFRQDIAAQNIRITAKDAEGNDIADSYSITWTKDLLNSNPDMNVFVATIKFNKDANYTFDIVDSEDPSAAYIGEAGNKALKHSYEFTVDTVDPEGSVTINDNKWTKFLDVITFGLYSNKKATVTVEATDITSPVTIQYAVGTGENDDYSSLEFKDYTESFEYTSDKQFDIYAKITDYAGHQILINSDGYIVDQTTTGLTVEIADEPNANNIFGLADVKTYDVGGNKVKGVKVDIAANENSDTYSGIKEIRYEVSALINGKTEITQAETLYKFDYVRDAGDNSNGGTLTITDVNEKTVQKNGYVPSKEDLRNSWNGSIIVDAAKNNSSFVTVTVTVTDNAGNVVEKKVNLDINITVPTINVSFDNNTSKNDKYFDASRTATITITDRDNHFNSEDALNRIVITAKDAENNDVEDAVIINGWQSAPNGSNPDDTKHTATVKFAEDANYTFAVSYVSYSGNENADVVYADETVASNEFTVDTVAPEEATITINDRVWSKILKVLTFGLYSNTKADVVIEANDTISPVVVEYFKTNDPIVKTKAFLDKQTFVPYEKFTVNANEQFVVYVKVSDLAGNYRYISSDGYIVDLEKPGITLSPDAPNENGMYNRDVNIAIEATDAAPYSGIAKIEYWIVTDGEETKRQTLYSFDYTREEGENTNNGKLTITDRATGEEVVENYEGNVPTQAQLKEKWNGSIVVNAALNNSSNVKVFVGVTDNAGNYTETSQKLDIDVVAPSIKVTYADTFNEGAVEGYYTSRTATVEITERTLHFNKALATDGITITAVDVDKKEVNSAYTISDWTTVEGATPDEAVHTAVITYAANANYTFAIEYADKADNKNIPVDVTGQKTPYKFTVDNTAPTGSITATSKNTDNSSRTETWTGLVENLVFGFWSNKQISITASNADKTSPIMKVEYYMPISANATDETDALKFADLDKVTMWKPYNDFDVKANTQFTVYLKITDNAGNYTYISTNGLLIDDQHPLDESVAPEISAVPEKPVNGIYSDDVKVTITVKDPLVSGTYSGLKNVKYAVFDRDSATPDVPTQEGELFNFTIVNPKQSELVQSITKEIVVEAAKNNSNNIQIVVYATDNSLNYVDNSQANANSYCVIKVDITAPKVDITYNNNNADSGKYFKADRTATIKVTERNFDSKDFITTITNTDEIIPVISAWKTTEGKLNKDDTVHTATLLYNADGDYTFDAQFTDKAGLKTAAVNYGASVAAKDFTVDKTIPVVTVTYDNNNAANTNYFSSGRTATVVIDEHNFTQDRIALSLTATDDGANTTLPSVGAWKTEGDKHTAIINYPGDALYSFDIDFRDLAGNNIADYAAESFYVDNTDPVIEFKDVVDKMPYGDVIKPVVTCTDTNYNPNSIRLTLTGANRGTVSPVGGYSEVHNGKQFNFSDFAREEKIDDIYTLTASISDMAGRQVTKTINFSVNRFGSVYTLDDSTKKLNNSHVKEATDVVIREVNATELSDIKITLNKNSKIIELEKDKDYKITVTGGNGKWYDYTYTIFKENFADDGVYKITVYSKDAAGNEAQNTLDTKNTDIGFIVDKTAPTLNIKNLANGATYPVESYEVMFSGADNLNLTKLTVYLDGKEFAKWEGEALQTLLDSGDDFTFTVPGADTYTSHSVKVVAVDAAGNTHESDISDFFVTTNIWIQFYNNKPLFYGSIAGVIVLAGLIVFLVVYKRRKDEKKQK